MRITTTIPIDNSAEEFAAAVAMADADELLLSLSTHSAELERTSEDRPLANRLSVATLAHAATCANDATSHELAGVPATMDELLARANGLAERDYSVELTPDALHRHNLVFVVRMIALHEMLMGPLKRDLGRSELLLKQLLPPIVGNASNPLDALPAALGGTLDELRAFHFAIFAAATAGASSRALTSERMWSSTRNPRRLVQLAEAFTRTVPELRSLSRTERRYAPRTPQSLRYGYPILRDYPIVRLRDGSTTIPVARYPARILSDGIYDALQSHYRGQKGSPWERFSQVFGDLAEGYVKLRFERTLGPNHYVALPRLRGDLSPDGYHATGDCVIEVKGRRLPPQVRLTGDIDAVAKFVKGEGGIAHGVAQMLSEIQRTRSGRGRGLDRDFLDQMTPCLISPDGLPGFHLQPVRQWVIAAVLDELSTRWPHLATELVAIHRFEWLSFDEFDAFVRASRQSSRPFGFLVRDYRSAVDRLPALDGVAGTFAPAPEPWLRAHNMIPPDDELIDDAFYTLTRECTGSLFASSGKVA
jgi:hypothetical protein